MWQRKKQIILILKLNKQINEVFYRNEWHLKNKQIIFHEITRLYGTFPLPILIFVIMTLNFLLRKEMDLIEDQLKSFKNNPHSRYCKSVYSNSPVCRKVREN